MKHALLACAGLWLLSGACGLHHLRAQEASSGLDLRATVTGQMVASSELTEEPRSGSPVIAGGRGILYPTWKANDHFFVSGALQLASRPYFFEDLSTAGYGAKGDILQAAANYSRVSGKGSLLLRAGILPTAFGSFMLRYDDMDNALIDLPSGYGYYYTPVSIAGLAGAQIDATRGRWDARAQFANSSPANPRSLLDKDQYGNWAGGAGFTIRQGLRVGASAYYGPYLYRGYKYYRSGEAPPSTLRARAFGADGAWSRGHSSLLGEVQHFTMPYTKFPTFHETAGYAEFKQVLNPRWYVAARAGGMRSASSSQETFEFAAGYRPNRFQLVKVGYQTEHYKTSTDDHDNRFVVQLVTTLHRAFGAK